MTDNVRAISLTEMPYDGLALVYLKTDGQLYQQLFGDDWMAGETELGTQTTVRTFAIGTYAAGHREVYYAATAGGLFRSWELGIGGSWSGEHSLGAPHNAALVLRGAINGHGGHELVYIGTDKRLYRNQQTTGTREPPNDTWGEEAYLGTDTNFAKQLAVAGNYDSRLEAFYVGTDNVVYHNYQTQPDGSWSGESLWRDADTKARRLWLIGTGNTPELQLLYIGLDNRLYHGCQTRPASQGGWDPPRLLDALGMEVKFLTVFASGGTLHVFAAALDGKVYYAWKPWEEWWQGGEPLGAVTRAPQAMACRPYRDGRFALFYLNSNRIYSTTQAARDGDWMAEEEI